MRLFVLNVYIDQAIGVNYEMRWYQMFSRNKQTNKQMNVSFDKFMQINKPNCNNSMLCKGDFELRQSSIIDFRDLNRYFFEFFFTNMSFVWGLLHGFVTNTLFSREFSSFSIKLCWWFGFCFWFIRLKKDEKRIVFELRVHVHFGFETSNRSGACMHARTHAHSQTLSIWIANKLH